MPTLGDEPFRFPRAGVEFAAKANAAHAGVANLTFRTGDVYGLLFDENSFDAVWVHAVLEHLAAPLAALREMYRVLNPGGIIGVRELDLDSLLYASKSPAMMRFFQLWIRLTCDNGGDAQVGKKLAGLLIATRFGEVRMSATIEQYGQTARPSFVPAEVAASNLIGLLGQCEARGYAPSVEIAEMRQALTDFAGTTFIWALLGLCELVRLDCGQSDLNAHEVPPHSSLSASIVPNDHMPYGSSIG